MQPPSRKRLYALLAVAMAAVFVEGTAWLTEWLLPLRATSTLLPSAGFHDGIEHQMAEAAQREGLTIPMVEDDSLGWKLPPSRTEVQGHVTARYNSDGLRGPEITPPEPGQARLFTLGDSSIFGFGVGEQQIFSAVAARALSTDWNLPVDVVIGAIPGHDSAQSLRVLKKFGARVQPDWVVIGNLWSDLYAVGGRLRAKEDLADYARGPLRRLATYRMLVRLVTPWLRTNYVRWMTSAADLGTADGTRIHRVDLASYTQNLEDMLLQARGLGACTAFVALPAPMDFDVGAPPETILLYREAMRLVASRHDAPFLDGPRALRERGGGMGCFLDQVHPNTLGHAMLGEALTALIASHGPCMEAENAKHQP